MTLNSGDQNTEQSAEVTCPKCGHRQELTVPNDKCLPFYVCDDCRETVGVPEESENCCVICEYSDQVCPVGHKSVSTDQGTVE